jgi:O-antigen/teichoic acid export membrane protein
VRDRGRRADLLIVLSYLILAVAFFGPVTLGGKTILPADNAFAWQPWQSYAAQVGVTVPHNGLVSDLYLENYVWKRFIANALRAGELPLWNPYIFAGVPFWAAGQHSALYPLSVLFYVLPIPLAFGWFAALHLFLAGTWTYILGRTLHLRRVAAMLAGTAFMFSGFVVTHNVFPMIMAAMIWLPLILAVIERVIQRAGQQGGALLRQIPDLLVGTAALGMVTLAGHPEMYYYVGLVSVAFGLWRLVSLGRARGLVATVQTATLLMAMGLLGLGLGSAQWLPLYDLVRGNFRQGSTSFREVLGWAFPLRRIIALLIPDFYGNPAHHSYWDLFSWRQVAVTVNATGQPIDTIYWGIKNYVEGAGYLGVLPVLLALVAMLRRRGQQWGFFAVLTLISLAFVFGSPLYIVIYKLPGLNQVHSPFRWIYPYTLSMAILAGMGLQAICDAGSRGDKHALCEPGERGMETAPTGRSVDPVSRGVGGALSEPGERGMDARGAATAAMPRLWRALCSFCDRLAHLVPWLALVGGLGLLALLALSLLAKERVASLAERAMQGLALAPQAFADGRMFYSYQFRNLLIFGLALAGSGLLLVARPHFRRVVPWAMLAMGIVLGELFVIGRCFFPAIDPALVAYRTPAIDWLKGDASLYRITSYVGGDEKTLNANTPMFYDIQDVRGYDSIIPRQYVDYVRLIQEQGELPYNRIAPLVNKYAASLDSPLLDLLNVKYVVATGEHTINARGYTLAYDAEIRIYRNEEVLPRAFLVARAAVIPDAVQRQEALRKLEPWKLVILEETPALESGASVPVTWNQQVEKIDYGISEVSVTVDTPIPAFLILGDSYSDGWLAFIRPDRADADAALLEQELHIYRANGNFRAVEIPPGRHIVRFKYSPNPVKYGLYMSFLCAIMVLLAAGAWAWGRFYREPKDEDTVRRVTKNTVAPIVLSLVNKGIDMVFAMLMLRILGPANAGEFYLAVVIISWFDIFTNFGLNTLLTREVAKDRASANRYLANTNLLRLGLWTASVPLLALFLLVRRMTTPLQPATVLAIALFGVALIPSNMSAGYSAVFNAYELMEIPASVTTMTTLLRVILSMVALVVWGGYVSLAIVSIVVNVATMLVLGYLLRARLFRPCWEMDLPFQRQMLLAAYPLMINQLLATLFFKVAVVLLDWLMKDSRVVGWYSTAYKYIDAIGIIPAYFTIAIFPMLSRYAASAKGSLLRAHRLSIKLLLIVAMPGALLGWGLSREMITVLGGSQYLPYAANILQVMIWYMPFGFINSVTQYVLIALDQQRFLTRAFIIGLAFNVLANVILIARFGYMAAAYVAILSEMVLLIPFYVGIRRHLGPLPLMQLAWKQVLSAVPMALLLALLPHRYLLLTLPAGLLLYCLGLVSLRVFDAEERQVVGQVISLQRIRHSLGRIVGRAMS